MSSSRRAFGLLFATLYEGYEKDSAVVTRPVPDSAHPMLYAVDSSAARHLLVPIDDDYAFTEVHGDVLSLTDWVDPRTGHRHMDLMCGSDQFHEVFSSLVDDITRRVQAADHEPGAVVQGVLREWKHLLRPARTMRSETRRGLFGELEVLSWLASRNANYALDSWTGPSGAVHDMTTPRADLEVKASDKEGLSVVISSLEQLNPPADHPLVLVRVPVRESPSGQTIQDRVEELVDLGVSRSELVGKLAEYGFLLGTDPDDVRYETLEPSVAWSVGQDFPGLRSADLPEQRRHAITRVRYTLDLVAEQPLSDEELSACLDEMMSEQP